MLLIKVGELMSFKHRSPAGEGCICKAGEGESIDNIQLSRGISPCYQPMIGTWAVAYNVRGGIDNMRGYTVVFVRLRCLTS